MANKKSSKKDSLNGGMKVNGILIGLIASVILNLILMAPYVALFQTNQLDKTAGNIFVSKTFESEIIKIGDKGYGCYKSYMTPELAAKNQRLCMTSIVIDANNQEVK
ncbi:MAG: hypothetical protein WCI47_02825 [bacterium]